MVSKTVRGDIVLISFMLIALTSCSTQQVKQQTSPQPASEPSPPASDAVQFTGQNPPLTVSKNGKILNLVRIMDGGACKNDIQGAKGTFLLYADPADIERIKREKGAKIFGDFENKIQSLSTEALQRAIDASNLAEDPFALGEDEAQQKLAKQLVNNFHRAIADAIAAFEKETTLTIDINAFAPSLVFYQKGCEVTTGDDNPDTTD